MNNPDLIKVRQYDLDKNIHSNDGAAAITKPLMISPSSIASIEAKDGKYGIRAHIVMKEKNNNDNNIFYEVVDSIDEINELVRLACRTDHQKSMDALEAMKRS